MIDKISFALQHLRYCYTKAADFQVALTEL